MKKLALELQELLGDEFEVTAWVVDYKWDKITISKGDKEIDLFLTNLTQITRPNGISEYVESK